MAKVTHIQKSKKQLTRLQAERKLAQATTPEECAEFLSHSNKHVSGWAKHKLLAKFADSEQAKALKV